MADSKHVKILKRGVEAWNKWRQAKPYISPNLSDTDLSGMDLRAINFSNTNLSHSKLKGTNFGIDNSRRTGPRWAIVPALTYPNLDENRANFTNAVLYYFYVVVACQNAS